MIIRVKNRFFAILILSAMTISQLLTQYVISKINFAGAKPAFINNQDIAKGLFIGIPIVNFVVKF